MFRFLLPLALIAAPSAVAAQQADPQLTLEQRAMVRCSAAFALIANGQANGDSAALAYPDMRQSGREFFVRSLARLMEEANLSRDVVTVLLRDAAQDIARNGTLHDIVPVCLPLLDD